MKIPYSWVREFVDVKLSAEDAADRLVNAGLEVASVTPLAPAGLNGAVVGVVKITNPAFTAPELAAQEVAAARIAERAPDLRVATTTTDAAGTPRSIVADTSE